MPNKKPNIVLVKWRDARLYSGTRKEDEIQNCRMAVFESVGYLVSRDGMTTVIAAEHNDEEEYRDITLIPTGSIISIRSLLAVPFV